MSTLRIFPAVRFDVAFCVTLTWLHVPQQVRYNIEYDVGRRNTDQPSAGAASLTSLLNVGNTHLSWLCVSCSYSNTEYRTKGSYGRRSWASPWSSYSGVACTIRCVENPSFILISLTQMISWCSSPAHLYWWSSPASTFTGNIQCVEYICIN